MPDFDPDTSFDNDPELAEIRREFSQGLPKRLRVLEDSLDSLAGGFSDDVANDFYTAAHSLKGTGASFGGPELAERAAELAARGMGWIDGRALPAGAIAAARAELERLAAAVLRFRTAIEGDAV
jgi:chemotaxis protein histidine kinase CheA